MKGDLQHPPEPLPHLTRALLRGECDCAVRSPFVPSSSVAPSWGSPKWVASRVAPVLCRLGEAMKDPLTGLFGSRREVYERCQRLDRVVGVYDHFGNALQMPECSCHESTNRLWSTRLWASQDVGRSRTRLPAAPPAAFCFRNERRLYDVSPGVPVKEKMRMPGRNSADSAYTTKHRRNYKRGRSWERGLGVGAARTGGVRFELAVGK